MRKTGLICICFIFFNIGFSQNTFNTSSFNNQFLKSSNLPVIIINTHKKVIPNDRDISAEMGIISNENTINHVTDSFNCYGKINIQTRGSSSKRFPKKSYHFKTRTNTNLEMLVSLLGLPAESDWVLYAPYDDKSLMRDVLAYKISRDMGRYASRTIYVELIINNDYKGIYILEEKIKCSLNRVNISEIMPDDTSGDKITGGYILKIDRLHHQDNYHKMKAGFNLVTRIIKSKFNFIKENKLSHDIPLKKSKQAKTHSEYFESPYLPYHAKWQTIVFRFHTPDSKIIVPQQVNYIKNYMLKAEDALAGNYFTSNDSGFRKYFDTNSFIDYFIVNELTRNVDGYRLSTYFYKDRESHGGKIIMGPIWDFNISMGNANYCHGDDTAGWAYEFNSYCKNEEWLVPFWWKRMLQDSLFQNELKCRWYSLRQTTLSNKYLMNYIDSVALMLDQSQQRNFQRWQILGTYVWPNKYIFNTYAEEINYLKGWLIARLQWLDKNMPGNCNQHTN